MSESIFTKKKPKRKPKKGKRLTGMLRKNLLKFEEVDHTTRNK